MTQEPNPDAQNGRGIAIRSRLGHCCFAVVLAAACATGAAAVPAPAGGASRGEANSPADANLLTDLTSRLDGRACLCAGLLAGTEEESRLAREELLHLQGAILEALAPYADDADLEVRLRIADVLEEMALQTRITRMLASLPVEGRDPLLRFRQAQPALFAQVLSSDWERRAQAIRKLTRKTDPKRLAEPLVVLCLRHHSSELVAEAATAAARCDYRSDAVVDALCQAIVRFRDDQDISYRYGRPSASPLQASLDALETLGSPRAAPALLALLTEAPRGGSNSVFPELAEALAATGEKRAIPALVKNLERSRTYSWGWGMDNISGTTDLRDYSLLAVLEMTDQSCSSYKMMYFDGSRYGYGSVYVGFANEKERKAAYEKMKQWWATHSEKEPYKGLVPLAVASRDGSLTTRAIGAGTAHTRPATRPATAPAPNGGDLKEDLRPAVAAETRRLAERFRSTTYSARDAARRQLLGLQQAVFGPLADQTQDRDSDPGRRGLDVLGEALAESSLHAAGFPLEGEARGKFLAFAALEPNVARDAFSLSWPARVEALSRIASMEDPNALAEPLVAISLRDLTPQTILAAVRVAATGRYRSDAVVDALTELLAKSQPGDRYQSYRSGGDTENAPEAALAALTKIRSPRAAPALLAIILQGASTGQEASASLFDALAATGEMRVIPHLLESLKNTSVFSTHTFGNNRTVTRAPCDIPLLVLVKLTGQDPKAYAIETPTDYRYLVGFKNDKARQAALKKWNEWWDKNKGAPPYKDLQPLSLPTLTPPEDPSDPGRRFNRWQ